MISSIMLRTCRLLLPESDRSSLWFALSKNLGLLIATSSTEFWSDGFSGVNSAAAKMLCLETVKCAPTPSGLASEKEGSQGPGIRRRVRKRANSETMVGPSRTKSSSSNRESSVRSGETFARLRTKAWYDSEEFWLEDEELRLCCSPMIDILPSKHT